MNNLYKEKIAETVASDYNTLPNDHLIQDGIPT